MAFSTSALSSSSVKGCVALRILLFALNSPQFATWVPVYVDSVLALAGAPVELGAWVLPHEAPEFKAQALEVLPVGEVGQPNSAERRHFAVLGSSWSRCRGYLIRVALDRRWRPPSVHENGGSPVPRTELVLPTFRSSSCLSLPPSAHQCLSRPDQKSQIAAKNQGVAGFAGLLANVRVASSNLVSCSI